MRSISTASVLRSLYLAERLASRPQVPGHLLLLASLDTSTALPAQLGLRCHEMAVLPAWRRSCPRDNDRLSLSDLLGDLTAWGSSSCCCSAPQARGVAQAMPRHGQQDALYRPSLPPSPPVTPLASRSPVPRVLLAQRYCYLCPRLICQSTRHRPATSVLTSHLCPTI